MTRSTPLRLFVCLLVAATLSCGGRFWRASFSPTAPDASAAPFLKCHTGAGELYVLEAWSVDKGNRKVAGNGIRYDADRHVVRTGQFVLSFDEVALFETNRPETVVGTGAVVMGVMSGASLVLSALCLSNPKACFGSCPTFFVGDGNDQPLQAEGFSEAIAPSLEKTDVDALYLAPGTRGPLEVRMTNDALETHVVNHVRLLAAPRPPGGRVFSTRSAFWAASALAAPTSCRAPAGDCLAAVHAADVEEYRSMTDGRDLAAPEVVELTFDRPPAMKLGVVLRARNSLLNTYLFYQALAYAGRDAGEWLMRLNRADAQTREAFGGPGKLLGDVAVSVRVGDRWIDAGRFSEVGPIAKETQLVTLPDLPAELGPVHVRLIMTRGNWRIDQLALAELAGTVTPTVLDPLRVTRAGADRPDVLAELRDPSRRLVTYPGDEYSLHFDVPDDDSELFLESRGYYVEWIREQWLPEQDEGRVASLLVDPSGTLRRLAPEFKVLEPTMEQVFWQSGYGR